nr:RNA-directed DNA polymerase, eukaryota, nucleotide-binding alpha-beta plait domain protein [Tanacetum cinerariifolium]
MVTKVHSNADLTRTISKSIFVANFSDNTTSADLWKICQTYGVVVDVYIPNHRSKVGKRFAFVRFIKVTNVARLVGNLCTLWIGRMHLHANVVRFERTPFQQSQPPPPTRPGKIAPSFVSAVKDGTLKEDHNIRGNAKMKFVLNIHIYFPTFHYHPAKSRDEIFFMEEG